MFSTRYYCKNCKTILELTSNENDFNATIQGYCGHQLSEVK